MNDIQKQIYDAYRIDLKLAIESKDSYLYESIKKDFDNFCEEIGL